MKPFYAFAVGLAIGVCALYVAWYDWTHISTQEILDMQKAYGVR